MLDTRLKKTHKLTTLIITLVVLIPALILTALYPRMEEAANQKRQEYQTGNEDVPDGESWVVLEEFPSYVVEATYCMYANHLLNDIENQIQNGEEDVREISLGALEQYGWMDDYYYLESNTGYYVECGSWGEESKENKEGLTGWMKASKTQLELEELMAYEGDSKDKIAEMQKRDIVAYLEIIYDSNGNLTKVHLYTTDGVEYYGNERAQAEKSIIQYASNAEAYSMEYGVDIDKNDVRPKDLRGIFAIEKDSEFLYLENGPYYINSSPQLYLDTGAIAVVLAMAAIVALFALLLPFIKKLETGWEKPFSLPFEVMCVILTAGICGAIFMYEAMCYTSMYELTSILPDNVLSFLGFNITVDALYGMLLVLNFVGWAILFWMEYMVVSSFRQFLCRPKYYLKNRVLCVRFVRWCMGKVKTFFHYVTNCELSQNLHKKLLIVVGVNGALVILLCIGWLFGAIGAIAYTIVLYVILRKVMENVQKDYVNVTETVHHMAEGNLNIAVPEELGAFQSLGDELSQVKDGFAKAIAEEAKSQSMKTELITNVSHDLKTPLTAIITYVDLLGKDDITEEERKSYIATLEKKSQRLKVLIEDLFEVSKAQSGNVKMNPMNVDVVNLMKQVRTEMEDKIAESDLSFRWNLPEEKVILYLDGQKTYRVFENLLNNILKYAMPHSRVYVDMLHDAAQVQIMFRNMSKVELDFDAEHLTDRFVRGDASRNSEGSGLGLAIAKSFVELQGGTFQIDVDGDLFKVVLKWNK